MANYLDINEDSNLSSSCDELLVTSLSNEEMNTLPPQAPILEEKHTSQHHSKHNKAHKPTNKASKDIRKRRKDEILHLKAKVAELESTRTNLQTLVSLKKALSSPWEIEARNQCMLRDQAVVANTNFKLMIQQQQQVINALQKILTQKSTLYAPRLLNYGAEVNGYLGTDSFQRRTTMEAILDRQYRRLASVFLQTGLVDASEDLHVDHFVPSCYGREDYEVLRHRVIENMDYRHFSTAILKFCRGVNLMPGMDATVLEDIDSSTVYTKFNTSASAWCAAHETKLLARRFIERNRIVFAWTSISTDELYPDNTTNGIQPTDCSWLVIEDATDKSFPSVKKTRLSVVAKSVVPYKCSSLEENLLASTEYNKIISDNPEREMYIQNFEAEVLEMAKLEIS